MSETTKEIYSSKFKNINTCDWYIDIRLINVSDNIIIELPADQVTYMKFSNSLEYYIPTLVLRLNDKNFRFTKFLKYTNLMLNVDIRQPNLTKDSNHNEPFDVKLNTMYVINNIKTLTIGKHEIIYEFFAEQLNVLNFIKNINYATNKKTIGESPYKIIQDICNKADIVVDSEYSDTDIKINFITSQNMTVIDSIDYCLKMGVFSKSKPPSYFYSRLLDQTSVIFNQDISAKKIIFPINMLMMNGLYSSAAPMGNFIQNVSFITEENQSQNLKNFGTKSFHDFDHNTRTWSQTTYSSDNILKTVAKITDNNLIESSVWGKQFFSPQYINNFSNYSHYKLYNSLRTIELCSVNLRFDCFGNLNRDCRAGNKYYFIRSRISKII